MKFLMICSYLPSALNFRGKLLEAIANQGYEIHIMAPELSTFPDEYQQLQSLGYTVHDIPMQRTGTNPLADLKLLKHLYQSIRRIQPDYVLSYTIKPVIYGTLASWLAKVPHRFALITGLGYAFQNVESGKRSLFQKMVHGLYAQALKHSDKVFFQNPDDLKLFQDMHLLEAEKPTVVVNGSGVNVQDFDVLPLPQNDAGTVKVSFLLIARLLGDKGVREYAEAARIIKAKHPATEFHLVGWIDDNPSAISQAELDAWIADDRLKYWGKLSDVRPAIAESSVYVLPSYREGTPRTVLEAMAMGRAIITTDAPGCRETVSHGVNGYLVGVKSVDDLVQCMQYFIEDPKLIEYMGQRSREIAMNKYDVHQVNKHMLAEMGIY
ncbi:glycosyltransferase family 4 protein [Acinetobacter towneri]|uniref:glycosyltransferase family 4 protein n=1 Tax=Acinetobacter towneri TaxID=202956 RepID=UPI001CE15F41|nr:glycosyltransferase family 4 protein [Acinetobacter towneri]MCA4780527.1 glycosyltransferase family 4 protein [Acinetobacter towneri]MCA4785855.1 glycosyltransferase family 4 protein [Acinetobacter towneri]MCA4788494.1 glycosyltransferase family 4 protein [Acinetobacter towneri]MCA4797001.1 glycosyltransferase family 4 protein [Acinetobacter towneri]MCA4802083.1 glycosyltransferase family 4 protein [Acinetobacter towneri]